MIKRSAQNSFQKVGNSKLHQVHKSSEKLEYSNNCLIRNFKKPQNGSEKLINSIKLSLNKFEFKI